MCRFALGLLLWDYAPSSGLFDERVLGASCVPGAGLGVGTVKKRVSVFSGSFQSGQWLVTRLCSKSAVKFGSLSHTLWSHVPILLVQMNRGEAWASGLFNKSITHKRNSPLRTSRRERYRINDYERLAQCRRKIQ